MRFVIRADASAVIGAGHVMRSSAIAEELIFRGYEVVLVSDIDDLQWVKTYISTVGFSSIVTSDKFANFVSSENILILDSYTISENDLCIQKSNWKSVVIVADPVTPEYKYDLLIHPGIESEWLGSDSNILAGPRFIPFRRSLIESKRKQFNNRLHIVVVGGGTNVMNFSDAICLRLRDIDSNFQVSVFSKSKQILPHDGRFTFFEVGSNLDSIASTAELVITTASTTSLEFVARRIPIGILHAVNNQISYYEALTSKGIAAPLGGYYDGSFHVDIKLLQDLVLSESTRNKYSNYSELSIDFCGSRRIVDEIIRFSYVKE